MLTQALVYVSERSQGRYERAIEGLPPGVERLEALLDGVLAEDCEAIETWKVWIDATAEALRMPELRRTIEERLNQWFELVALALEGLVEDEPPPAIPWTWRVDALLTGLATQALTSEAELHGERIREEVVRMVMSGGRQRADRVAPRARALATRAACIARPEVQTALERVAETPARPRSHGPIGSRPDARRHVPGPRRGGRRGSPRARAARPGRRDRADRGDRRVRLGPAHLPRPRADRTGLHDRPRVRRHGRRGRRRRLARRRRRPRARLLPHGLRRVLVLPPRPLPPLRAVAHLRARRDARLAAGHAGRDGAGPATPTSCCARCRRA